MLCYCLLAFLPFSGKMNWSSWKEELSLTLLFVFKTACFPLNVLLETVLIEVQLFTSNLTLNCIFSYLIQKEEIISCEERVKKLLELTPPKGSEFLHKIEHILEREKNWVSIFL